MRRRPEGVSAVLSRRRWLQGTAAAVASATIAAPLGARAEPLALPARAVKRGRIKQSVCSWCFTSDRSPRPMTIEELAQQAVALGIPSIELVNPKDWPILKRHGLVAALSSSHGFVKGFNNPQYHAMCIEKVTQVVDACADAGFPSVICFSGFREDVPDDVGLDNAVAGLKQVVGHAEKQRVNLILEVLNSRVDEDMKGHPGYMGDSVEWCVEVCKRVGSPRLKILFDVYHVQIMQGDLITRIRQYHEYIGHYHTAGVPGRNELDENQEINYPAVMRAIAETGYQGYVGHEFIPTRDPVESLRAAVELCDV